MNLSAAAFLLFIAASSGCGSNNPETIYVSGVVTLDEKPVENATVLFSPTTGRPAIGTTDAEGKFELRTFEDGDGAVPGTHAVTVTLKETTGITADPDGLSGEVAPGGIKTTWLVPEKYASPKTSGIQVDVDTSLELPVELKLTTEKM